MSQITNAVAVRDNGPGALVEQYRGDFAAVMPSHVKPETFMRLAVSVFNRDERLAKAAVNNPDAVIAALLEAARLGLEPGTEQYYLTPRWNGKTQREEVAGIRGYQGEIELIYRAGAASSVVVEAVRQQDAFIWAPGLFDTANPKRWEGPQERPFHGVHWFEERGDLVGVYAYAVMKDGATSKVVVLNRKQVMEAKALQSSSDKSWSPWQLHEEAMWLKTAAHRLTKWVPTSAEYMREQLRAVRDVAAEQPRPAPRPQPAPVQQQPQEPVYEAEFVDDGGES
ncbi:recombinase RecT [Streptodolium elevatio]|uniref:Recombinase RecT n=1 Tax=Streptodolium elevatio TaxID=3157996 RepID=A0ABV3DJW4_9ACTN